MTIPWDESMADEIDGVAGELGQEMNDILEEEDLAGLSEEQALRHTRLGTAYHFLEQAAEILRK